MDVIKEMYFFSSGVQEGRQKEGKGVLKGSFVWSVREDLDVLVAIVIELSKI